MYTFVGVEKFPLGFRRKNSVMVLRRARGWRGGILRDMKQTLRMADEIETRTDEILATWRESVPSDSENSDTFELLCRDIERVTLVFVEFMRSPESVETFSRGGATQALVREISVHQHALGRDAVGVIGDFAALRRAVFETVERHIDFEDVNGVEVARFFVKMIAASDWVTSVSLEAFEEIVREKMREALGRAAATDLVTGLPNSDLLNRLLLPNLVSEHERFSLAIFDVADFSDTIAQGKVKRARRALRRLAETVLEVAPESAVCARFGDDEVCVVLPEGTGEMAYRLAEDVLERLKSEKKGFDVDVGVSEYPAHGATAGAVSGAALKALKMAKRVGGGGIMVAH